MEKKDWEQRLEDFYFEREKILPSQSVGIDIDDWKEFISQELDKAREEGIVDYYSVDELYAIEDAFHLVLRNGGEWDDIGESAREKNWELIKLTTK